jgi:hypothetical protein
VRLFRSDERIVAYWAYRLPFDRVCVIYKRLVAMREELESILQQRFPLAYIKFQPLQLKVVKPKIPRAVGLTHMRMRMLRLQASRRCDHKPIMDILGQQPRTARVFWPLTTS